MTRGSVIIPSVILVAGARALAMSASSFWAGILRCSGTSPAFTIAGTPKGTASLRAMPHRAAAAARPRRRIDRIRSATSEFGTFETSHDVRSLVAIGGRADIARTSHFGSDWHQTDMARCPT